MKIIKKGQFFAIRKKFSQDEVLQFAKLCGDYNPLHYDKEFCRTSIFKEPIIHGILGASLFSNILGNNIKGSIYISQDLKFLKPIFIDEEIEAKVIIRDILNEKKRISLITQVIKVEANELAIDGSAFIKFPIEEYKIL
jgi:3-hydroxybutyryl-CoA dehydratase